MHPDPKIQFLSCRVSEVLFLNLQAVSHGRALLSDTELPALVSNSSCKSSARTGKGKLTFLFAFCVPFLSLLSWVNVGASSLFSPLTLLWYFFFIFFFLYTWGLRAATLPGYVRSFKAHLLPSFQPSGPF